MELLQRISVENNTNLSPMSQTCMKKRPARFTTVLAVSSIVRSPQTEIEMEGHIWRSRISVQVDVDVIND